jgi:hypothetical protein
MQFLETPERRDRLLTHLVAVAAARDDLQSTWRLRVLVRTQSAIQGKNQPKLAKNVALHFRESDTPQQATLKCPWIS